MDIKAVTVKFCGIPATDRERAKVRRSAAAKITLKHFMEYGNDKQ